MGEFPELEAYLKSMEWEDDDRRWLIRYWADAATNLPAGSKEYFRYLVDNANVPDAFRHQVADVFTGAANIDAGKLFRYAHGHGVNPQDPRYTTIASIILPTLEHAGADQALKLAALVVKYRLIVGRKTAEEFRQRYQVPVAAQSPDAEVSVGPDFRWQGPEDEIQLQGLLGDDPADYYVKFLKQAVTAASAVCRVEIEMDQERALIIRGTGFLIAPNLVLTNYHVLGESDEDVSAAAKRVRLRFGALTNLDSDAGEGQLVPVAAVLAMSPTAQDDFVLLEADASIGGCMGILPAVLSPEPAPSAGDGLHILHHPGGDAMKISISKNGVARVLAEQGKIQYFGKTLPGSSGAPCFDDQFQVVALHHAVRSRFAGVICQGILISAIRERLAAHL